jgi:hypothetical protein
MCMRRGKQHGHAYASVRDGGVVGNGDDGGEGGATGMVTMEW